MSTIYNFFKFILTANTILLNPQPITIDKDYLLLLDKHLNVISENATLEIELVDTCSEINSIVERRKCVIEIFPFYSVRADVYTAGVDRISLSYTAVSLANEGGKNKVRLVLTGINEKLLGKEFYKVNIQTDKPLRRVYLYWNNARK